MTVSSVGWHRPGGHVVVCGVSRSGTSLVHAMIGAHHTAQPLRETHLFRFYNGSTRVRRRLRRMTPHERAAILARDSYLAREPAIAQFLVHTASSGLEAEDWYPALVSAATLSTVARPQPLCRVESTIVVDKDPRYLDQMVGLSRAVPDVRFVVCVRSAAGVLASKQNTAWSKHRTLWLNALVGAVQTAGLVTTVRRHPDLADRVTLVAYESVVSGAPEVLARLCRQLDLPDPSPTSAEWRAMAARLVTREERAWKDRTQGPVEAAPRHAATQAAMVRRPFLRRIGLIQDRLASAAESNGGVLSGSDVLASLAVGRAVAGLVELVGRMYLAAVVSGVLANRTEARRRAGVR